MAVDTANKRRSVFGLDGDFLLIYPLPDGSLTSVADRRHLLGLYRFEEVVPPGPAVPIVTWELAERNLPGEDTWPLEPRDLDWNLEARAFDLELDTRNLTAQNTWSVHLRALDWTIKIRE